jgi:hypothetical protein
MKNITRICVLSVVFLTNAAFAGDSLQAACNGYGGNLITNVTVRNYNSHTIKGQVSVQVSQSTTWYNISADNKSSSFMYDMIKTARLTGEKVDICQNPNGNYLLGVEWTRPVSSEV